MNFLNLHIFTPELFFCNSSKGLGFVGLKSTELLVIPNMCNKANLVLIYISLDVLFLHSWLVIKVNVINKSKVLCRVHTRRSYLYLIADYSYHSLHRCSSFVVLQLCRFYCADFYVYFNIFFNSASSVSSVPCLLYRMCSICKIYINLIAKRSLF